MRDLRTSKSYECVVVFKEVTFTLTLLLPQDGTTPLYMASQENHVEVIKLLLASGANINLAKKVRNEYTVDKSMILPQFLGIP